MGKALGFLEISGVVAAVDALDLMAKAADVEFVTWEKKLGGRLVTVIVRGEVSAVTAAIEAASQGAIKKPVCKAVIANPHSEIERIVEKSAARLYRSRHPQAKETAQQHTDNESYIKEI
ncbi:MAG: BMC domain-containing protein [Candidatus Borkfalkiaceae bacterium]|nr:BMC domain-containing protein [Christensenellaceae bacterium]